MIKIYFKTDDGQTHTVESARLIPEGEHHEGMFAIFVDCCPTVFHVTPEQFDQMVSLHVTE